MSQEEMDTIDEVNENQGADDFKQEGQHSEKWCKIGLRTGKTKLVCADCQREKERKATYEVKPEFNAYSNKDRRISFLSIFSSLNNLATHVADGAGEKIAEEMAKQAYEINEELYKHYPTEEK